MNIYSRRCTFSTLTVTSNLTTCKAYLEQVTRACCLQSLVFVKLRVIAPFTERRSQVWSHNELKAIRRIVGQQTFYHKVVSFLFFFSCFLLKGKDEQYE